jgi:hypothetical protein
MSSKFVEPHIMQLSKSTAHNVFLAFCFILFHVVALSQKFTINGYVKDAKSGETLIGASITITESGKGVTTNAYGFYSLTLEKGTYELVFSYVGYQPDVYKITLNGNKDYNSLMQPMKSDNANEVVVTGRRRDQNVHAAQMGKVDLSIEKIKQIPALMGEVDILKAIQLLPGVSNAGEGNAGIYIRGGGPDQNLIVLDDAVVYNPGHLFGFFSVFNGDAVKNVSLIKGGMPAQYGGRLSGVVDVSMKDGNNQELEVEGGIGLIASRFSVQGPIQKNKSSFMLSARRTYVDALIKPFISKDANLYGSGYYFYDVNAKMNFDLGSKDRIFLSGYFGRDVFDFNSRQRAFKTNVPWGNSTGTIRWNHEFSRKLFANTTLVYNDYNFKFDATQYDFRVVLSSGIRDLTAKVDFDWFPAPEHKVKYGGQFTYHTFIPNQFSGNQGETELPSSNAEKKYANEYAFFIQDDWDLSNKVKLNGGLRWSGYQQVGPYTRFNKDADGNPTDSTNFKRGEPVQWYSGFEPRLTMRYALDKTSSLKGGVTRNMQYIHLATNSASTLPTDLWVSSTYRVPPQTGWQYALGYFKNLENNKWETSVEVYYKNMSSQIEYREGFTPSLNDPEEDFVFGKGWSYGAEFFVNKTRGRLNGWIGYTLSWTWRQFADLNDGQKYPAKFDRRHDISVVANYEISKKWKFGGVFVYASGNAATFPERFYFIEGVLTQEFSRINAYRMPAYHRMDVGFTYTPKPNSTRKYKSSWVFSVYNLYSRLNPYFIYFSQSGSPAGGDQQIEAVKVSIFPILPSVTWNFKF